MGLGGLLLDEVRRHEKAVALADIFRTPPEAGKRDIFRISSDEGVIYEMALVGHWEHDMDRLLEFDRPSRNRLRVYGHPHHLIRREIIMERHGTQADVVLYEMMVPYQDLFLKDVLRMTGVQNLQRIEEDVPLSKFIEVFSDLDDGSPDAAMIRYIVRQEGDGTQVESKSCAALAETAFDNMVEVRTRDGWKVTQRKNHVLEADEARKVREYTKGIGICTYWSDADCSEFGEKIIKEERRDILESRVKFYEFITAMRRGEESSLSSFVESRLYPDEPIS